MHMLPQTSKRFQSVFAACLRYKVQTAAVGKTVLFFVLFFSAYARDEHTKSNETGEIYSISTIPMKF